MREVHLVRVNFGEHHLLREAHVVVAVAIERSGVDPAKVTNSGQCEVYQSVEKLVHPFATKRDATTNFLPLAESERTDRLLRPCDLRSLTGNLTELFGGFTKAVFVLECLADTHVQDDLLNLRNAMNVVPTELGLECGDNLFREFIVQPGHDPSTSLRPQF